MGVRRFLRRAEFTANGEQCLNCLSQPRGQPQILQELPQSSQSKILLEAYRTAAQTAHMEYRDFRTQSELCSCYLTSHPCADCVFQTFAYWEFDHVRASAPVAAPKTGIQSQISTLIALARTSTSSDSRTVESDRSGAVRGKRARYPPLISRLHLFAARIGSRKMP